jgi:hypothetical protein
VVVAGFSKRPPNWFKQRNALELATVYKKKAIKAAEAVFDRVVSGFLPSMDSERCCFASTRRPAQPLK